MNITNLQARPDKREETLQLIETSLGYSEEFHFAIDFAPLIINANASNNYIVIQDDIVVAHVGIKKRKLKIKESTWDIGFLGGICTHEKYRGKGLLRELLEYIFAHEHNIGLFLLWSNNLDVYSKFSFFMAFEQYQYHLKDQFTGPSNQFEKTRWKRLSIEERLQLDEIFQEKIVSRFSTILRSERDWNEIGLVESADLYVKREGERIKDFFFVNKGQDLAGIIHESSVHPGDVDFLEVLKNGNLWSPISINEDNQPFEKGNFYTCLCRVGNSEAFERMIITISKGKIHPKILEYQKCEINSQIYTFQEVLNGIWGPTFIEEWQKIIQPIYISGMDSI